MAQKNDVYTAIQWTYSDITVKPIHEVVLRYDVQRGSIKHRVELDVDGSMVYFSKADFYWHDPDWNDQKVAACVGGMLLAIEFRTDYKTVTECWRVEPTLISNPNDSVTYTLPDVTSNAPVYDTSIK